jgi:3,4-dihydroxy 2-butanone 4-phosphate synthase/GTP cyclohydrolase II
MFNTIEEGLMALKSGKPVILVDNEARENEGDLILPAEFTTAEHINFMTQHARGLICLSLSEADFERLEIPMMVERNRTPYQTAFGVSFEAAQGVSTGISAQDRAHSILTAINPQSGPNDLIMPGHMFPLKARNGGVLVRPGHTEGSIDLMRLSGLQPAAVICEIMHDDGSMARLPDLITYAQQHQLCLLKIDDLIQYRLTHETLVKNLASARLPIEGIGEFQLTVFQFLDQKEEHLALTPIKTNHQYNTKNNNNLVRLHSECLTGDVFGSMRCDCGAQLHKALAQIMQEGGALLYLRQEGRGIGLTNKIKAYALQDQGRDTVEANQELGFVADARNNTGYAVAAQILKFLNLTNIRLLTNNPNKMAGLIQHGIEVIERVSLEISPNACNQAYLKTKRDKLGHVLNLIK